MGLENKPIVSAVPEEPQQPLQVSTTVKRIQAQQTGSVGDDIIPCDTAFPGKVICHKVYVKAADDKGDGAYAARDIKKGELVECGLARRLPMDGNKSVMVFTWSEDRTQWATLGGMAMFYNCSTEPNTKMDRIFDEDRFEIYALRDIKKDEELTHQYKSLQWRTCFNSLAEGLGKEVEKKE